MDNLPSSEITPESLYLRRREFLRDALLFTVTSTSAGAGLLWLMQGNRASDRKSSSVKKSALTIAGSSPFNTTEPQTPYEAITTYNNFYEFGLDKSDPAANAHTLRPRPWTLRVEGEVRKPLEIDIDQLLKWFPLVDCSVSFGTNCGALLFCPGVQVPARPGPVKGMRKAAIVLRPTGIEVIDQLLP